MKCQSHFVITRKNFFYPSRFIECTDKRYRYHQFLISILPVYQRGQYHLGSWNRKCHSSCQPTWADSSKRSLLHGPDKQLRAHKVCWRTRLEHLVHSVSLLFLQPWTHPFNLSKRKLGNNYILPLPQPIHLQPFNGTDPNFNYQITEVKQIFFITGYVQQTPYYYENNISMFCLSLQILGPCYPNLDINQSG